MRIVIFGGTGKIGSAITWDLVRQPEVKMVGLVSRTNSSLKEIKGRLKSNKVVIHHLDVENKEKTKKLMKGYDVGVVSLPDRKTSYLAAEAAIEVGLDMVDILEEYHRRPENHEIEGLKVEQKMNLQKYGEHLHQRAVKNGVTFLDGMGFAPGLSNITVGEGIRKIGRAKSAIARVGGIPSKKAAAKHPLKYMITWAFSHVLREYMVKVKIIKGGKIVEVDALTEPERFIFDKFGKKEVLECAITPGMPSFIFTRNKLQDFTEKTIRWPGHWEKIQALKECGLLDLNEVNFQGKKIIPREFLLSVIEPKLKAGAGDTDICIMWNTVRGGKNGQKRVDYYMWDEADTKNGISSMARVTGFSAAVAALFLAKGKIKTKGIVAPEDAIYGKLYQEFLKELEKRKIKILEIANF